ncbi:hypothetical protein A9R16_003240 [Acidiferrobacter thiooxydans]|uniref:hypothetical protein n=1 Tax=Acidiferrobacter thiooxydans TaxID=163359 RepID=UPI000824BB18|nr:hypothetical protein [Acidiferrobacter thiooxydans]UEO00431.1 hypothetical protein A9R16_003240 [Acidiferrobacter thiooxydans]
MGVQAEPACIGGRRHRGVAVLLERADHRLIVAFDGASERVEALYKRPGLRAPVSAGRRPSPSLIVPRILVTAPASGGRHPSPYGRLGARVRATSPTLAPARACRSAPRHGFAGVSMGRVLEAGRLQQDLAMFPVDGIKGGGSVWS